MVPIKIANFLAKYSCSKWNKCRPLRVICRHGYRAIAKHYAKLSVKATDYPWPYCDPQFANWEEDDGALVTDPANFVIRHSTSYCAWRIRELTGKWPAQKVVARDETHAQEIRSRERPHDAKYWVEFLQAQDCYIAVAETVHPMHHYIGIDPDYGEYGLVVWFESTRYNAKHDCVDRALVSTYENKQYVRKEVLFSDFTWVEVGKKAAPK